MLTRKVTYTDFEGKERTEELLFNLTRTELMEIAMDLPEGLTDNIEVDPKNPDGIDNEVAAKRILSALGGKGVVGFIKELVLKSYGKKSLDGRRFDKNDEILADFKNSLAFDQLYYELMTNDEKANEFINGIIPASLAKK